jgi:anti-sigma factor RsiW
VSHLGELLSALVDGELSGAELDRANAHVAACGACRVEANALRRLKHELRSLAEVSDADDVTRRLLALGSQAGQDALVPVRYLDRARDRRQSYSAVSARRRLMGRRRGRYMLWSTVSLVVVGIGTAAFGMGGGSGSTGPQITPQLEVFDVQHAIYSGDVPFADPTGVATRVPVGAATP